jgi:ArsR family transcriptional regulator
VLREAGLIAGERRGTCVCYRVLPDALRQVSALVVLDTTPA